MNRLFEEDDLILEKLKKTFIKPTDILDKNLTTSVFHPERKEVDYTIVSDTSSNIDPYNMYSSSDAESNLSNDRLIRRWRQLMLHPVANECVLEITNEAINMEPDFLKLNTNKIEEKLGDKLCRKIETSFAKICGLLDFEKNASKMFTQFFVDGQLNYEVIYKQNTKEGIVRLDMLSPLGLRKVYNIDTQKFGWKYNLTLDDVNNSVRYNNYIAGYNGTQEELDLADEQIVHSNSGLWDNSRKLYLSLVHYAMRSINQLHLVEDAMVMFRLTHSADAKVFKIDVGKMNRDKAEAYVNALKTRYENKKYYNTNTGSIDEQKQVRVYGENYWFPKMSDGRGTEVEVLTGANFNLGEMVDLDYFRNQVYCSFGIPKSRRSNAPESGAFDFPSAANANITRDEIKFFKLVRGIRTNFSGVLTDAMRKDLVSQKIITDAQWDEEIRPSLELIWKNDNEFYTIKKLQLLSQKLEILNAITPAKDEGYFTKDWIAENVLEFTRKEWEEMKKERYAQKDIDFADKNKDYYADPPDTPPDMQTEGKVNIKRTKENIDKNIDKYDLGEGDRIALDENTPYEKWYIVKNNKLVLLTDE